MTCLNKSCNLLCSFTRLATNFRVTCLTTFFATNDDDDEDDEDDDNNDDDEDDDKDDDDVENEINVKNVEWEIGRRVCWNLSK